MVTWPTSLGVSSTWEDYAEDITQSVLHGGPQEVAPKLDEYAAGDGRVVFDISHVTEVPAVLKVAYNDIGIDETRREVRSRDSVIQPFRDRLVPIYKHGHGHAWCMQPKCASVPPNERHNAVEALSDLAEDASLGTDEIYGRNVGLWNDTYVVYDYGGLF